MIVAVLGLCVLSGCQHAAPEAPAIGRSSFRFVEERAPAGSATASVTVEEPKSGDYFQEARPIEPLAQPVYPPKALAAKAGFTTVGVRIDVDREGRVTDVGPSLVALSIPSRFDEEFQDAVRAAVLQWRFRPAQRYHIEVGKNPAGEPEYHQTSRENTETYFDVSFTFTADGTVLSGPATGKR